MTLLRKRIPLGLSIVGCVASLGIPRQHAGAVATDAPEPSPSPAASTSPERLIRRVVDAYADRRKGTVAMRAHSILEVDAPFNHRKTMTDEWYVYENGDLAASSERPDPRRPLVHDPLSLASLPEYRYEAAPCIGCAPGQVAIAYTSRSEDAYHAHGTIVIDPSLDRVIHRTEMAYALPWPTKDGVLDIWWGQAAIGWFPIAVDGTFDGKVGPFAGTAHYVQKLAPYARYPDESSAVTALTAATGKPALLGTPTPDVSKAASP